MADSTDDATLRAILGSPRRIALVGASPKPDRPSHGVLRWLLARGHDVVPINPGLAGQVIAGRAVAASLAEGGGGFDMLDIFRRGAEAGGVVDEAIALGPAFWAQDKAEGGAGVVWMQLGVVDEDAAARARAAGLVPVMDRCPVIEANRLGL
jgi:predicted CoA-binding protein